jgi:hypothetical protein
VSNNILILSNLMFRTTGIARLNLDTTPLNNVHVSGVMMSLQWNKNSKLVYRTMRYELPKLKMILETAVPVLRTSECPKDKLPDSL